MKKYIVEFVGTFFLVLTIIMSVLGGAGSFAPLAIGSALMVMIYAGGHISGGHFNPAVTLAVFLRGKISSGDMLPYMAAQILGGVVAALVAALLLSGLAGATAPTPGVHASVPALIAEFLGTFALAWVVLNAATSKGTDGNSFYGLAIGFTVLAMAYALGGVSGGAFNPAVAIGLSVAEMFSWGEIWIYLVGCLGGGAVAAFLYNYINGND
ncbi:MAG: aquaporin [Saprospiraceae bacterium]|nr:aquaporin [Saprospiraceae bacterium]MBP7679693.1 aquaporin [Saprospiraceae bacterium]